MTQTTQDPSLQTANLGFRAVLRNRDFLLLWGAQVFSQLADKIFIVYMVALIAAHFPAELTSQMSSGIIVTSSIPAILFGSLAGVYVDRWPKKVVLVVSNLLRGLFVLAVPLLPVEYVVLIAITFLVSTLTQFFAPAETSTIPLIVEKRGLLSANSLFTVTMMAAAIVGFGIGDPLLTLTGGADGGHWILGGCYLASAALLAFMHTREKRNPQIRRTANFWKDLREGLVYLSQDPAVRFALIQLVILYSVIAALYPLAISLAPAIGLRAAQFGYLMSAASVGIGLGAAAIGKYGNHLPRTQLAFGGTVLMGLVLLGLYWATNVALVLGLTFVLGIGAACVGAPMQTLIQEQTPEHMRGKIFGLQNNLVNIALNVPLVLVERATALFGLRPVILGLGLVVVLAGFATRWLSSKFTE